MYELRRPTDEQKAFAAALGLSVKGKSFRVLTAEIADALEVKSFAVVEECGLTAGVEVEYVGPRPDMLSPLVISTVGRNGYLYFKWTAKYCRPWDVKVVATSGPEAHRGPPHPVTPAGEWITVNAWTDYGLKGQLASNPEVCRDLQAGQPTGIGQPDVFDQTTNWPDGGAEGGYTTDSIGQEGRKSEQ